MGVAISLPEIYVPKGGFFSKRRCAAELDDEKTALLSDGTGMIFLDDLSEDVAALILNFLTFSELLIFRRSSKGISARIHVTLSGLVRVGVSVDTIPECVGTLAVLEKHCPNIRSLNLQLLEFPQFCDFCISLPLTMEAASALKIKKKSTWTSQVLQFFRRRSKSSEEKDQETETEKEKEKEASHAFQRLESIMLSRSVPPFQIKDLLTKTLAVEASRLRVLSIPCDALAGIGRIPNLEALRLELSHEYGCHRGTPHRLSLDVARKLFEISNKLKILQINCYEIPVLSTFRGLTLPNLQHLSFESDVRYIFPASIDAAHYLGVPNISPNITEFHILVANPKDHLNTNFHNLLLPKLETLSLCSRLSENAVPWFDGVLKLNDKTCYPSLKMLRVLSYGTYGTVRDDKPDARKKFHRENVVTEFEDAAPGCEDYMSFPAVCERLGVML